MEKTRKSNHLLIKLQRQHFLLSYLKTLNVGPVGASNSRPPASELGPQPSESPVRSVQFWNGYGYSGQSPLLKKPAFHLICVNRQFHCVKRPRVNSWSSA